MFDELGINPLRFEAAEKDKKGESRLMYILDEDLCLTLGRAGGTVLESD